jgi:heme/copper-type cytochrome/quinol oxidase subunit 3
MTLGEGARRRPAIDVADLPDHAFGHRGLIWWGTTGFMVIEGSMFAIVLVAYFYLLHRVPAWPPGLPDPSLAPGIVGTVILLLSCVPNYFTKAAAEKYQLRRVQIGMCICIVLAVVAVVARAYEFKALNSSWNTNAYSSVTWVLLGLHTSHLLTDLLETTVLAAIVFTKEVDGPRYVDVSENALYWYFVVGSWIPVYLTIYLAPRWL